MGIVILLVTIILIHGTVSERRMQKRTLEMMQQLDQTRTVEHVPKTKKASNSSNDLLRELKELTELRDSLLLMERARTKQSDEHRCKARNYWYCSLRAGHPGQHIACYENDGEEICRWDQGKYESWLSRTQNVPKKIHAKA